MINKILAYFPDSVTQEFAPENPPSGYYWFLENIEKPLWIGIPKQHTSESQLELLKALYHFVEPKKNSVLSGSAHEWNRFLFHGGPAPSAVSDKVRFIQFHLQGKEIDTDEISGALDGFFPDHTILWLHDTYGLLIEEKKEVSENAEELESISSTFETDFYVKISFYIGKFQSETHQLPGFFQKEKELFQQAIKISAREKVYTFEKVFPIILSSSLPHPLRDILEVSILEEFKEDKELMATIKVFLESNSNASLAAKKLYVHRNTLQYRMDKFMERTGVHLKDFDTAIMVYLAVLYEEIH